MQTVDQSEVYNTTCLHPITLPDLAAHRFDNIAHMDASHLEILRQLEEEEDIEEEDFAEQQLVALAGMIWVGAEESRRLRAERRLAHRTYLTRCRADTEPSDGDPLAAAL